VGIHFDVEVDARMRGDYSWDRDGDGKLSIVGKSFFGRVREVKESAEMDYLKKAYTQLAGTLDGVYLFVVDAAGGLESQPKDLLGEMPRRSRFGYIFSGNSPNGGVSALSHTIAHELGHGLFTLQHTFDDEYGGTERQDQTRNLMDYTTGRELAAFQWNVLANPAVFTAADNKSQGDLVRRKKALVNAKNGGITPDGKVILSVKATNSDHIATLTIIPGSYYVHGITLFSRDRTPTKSYSWDEEKKTYVSGGESIEDAQELELTYNTRSQQVTARLYRVASGDECFYQYHDVTYDPANPSSLKIPERDWKTDYLWSASESCKAEFLRSILANDRRSYDEEQIKRDILKLGQLSEKTSYEDLLRTLESCHIRSLKRQSYEWLIRTFKQIAQKETLKEREELAILRLMQSMDGKDYSRFYRDLEANQNALLRHLVSEIDDVSLYFWTDKDNYTNFIGALVWMFNADGGKSIKGRFPEALDDYARIVLNLTPVKYGSVQLMGGGDASFTEKYNQGEYISSTGEVKLLDVYKTYTTTRNSLHSQEHREELGIVSPLTPIIIVPDTDNLPLIETALGGNALSDQMYVVPAIFMKYRADKIRNDNIAKGVVTAFDVATIVFSGGTALATKVHWIRRAWALAEVVGAVGNIAVNAQVITDPELKLAVDIYNTAMGVIGIKNAGQAGYKFVKNLPKQSKTLLQENKALRGLLASKYSDWKRIVSPKIDGLSLAEKQLLSQQEEVFKTLTSDPERKPIKIAEGGEAVAPSTKATSAAELEQLKHRSREVVSNHPEFKALNAGVQKEVLRQLDVAEEALQQELVTHPELVDEWLSIAAKDKKGQSRWIEQLLDGIRFNKERAPFYPFNEVYLESPKAGTRGAGKSSTKYKYVRLDSYNPRTGEIVSRKRTQLWRIPEEIAIRYLKELEAKYSPGSVIADVPSNRVGANAGIFEENGGKTLRGQMILEVPVQEKSVPERVLRYANLRGIKIRDVTNHIYNK
jgi:fibronectin type III domain protein